MNEEFREYMRVAKTKATAQLAVDFLLATAIIIWIVRCG